MNRCVCQVGDNRPKEIQENGNANPGRNQCVRAKNRMGPRHSKHAPYVFIFWNLARVGGRRAPQASLIAIHSKVAVNVVAPSAMLLRASMLASGTHLRAAPR